MPLLFQSQRSSSSQILPCQKTRGRTSKIAISSVPCPRFFLNTGSYYQQHTTQYIVKVKNQNTGYTTPLLSLFPDIRNTTPFLCKRRLHNANIGSTTCLNMRALGLAALALCAFCATTTVRSRRAMHMCVNVRSELVHVAMCRFGAVNICVRWHGRQLRVDRLGMCVYCVCWR